MCSSAKGNLRHTDLSGADLYGASLYGANLSGASLSGADLSGVICEKEKLNAAIDLIDTIHPLIL